MKQRSRRYIEQGIEWIPIAEFATEFHKTRPTIMRWFQDGLLARLGYTARRDLSGHWFIGQPLIPRSEQAASSKSAV